MVAKTKALIRFAVTANLVCVFVFAHAKKGFSHDAAQILYEPSGKQNLSSWFPTRSDTNWAVQSQRMILEIYNQEVEGLFYLCSENKGADCAADVCLCFHILRS